MHYGKAVVVGRLSLLTAESYRRSEAMAVHKQQTCDPARPCQSECKVRVGWALRCVGQLEPKSASAACSRCRACPAVGRRSGSRDIHSVIRSTTACSWVAGGSRWQGARVEAAAAGEHAGQTQRGQQRGSGLVVSRVSFRNVIHLQASAPSISQQLGATQQRATCAPGGTHWGRGAGASRRASCSACEWSSL